MFADDSLLILFFQILPVGWAFPALPKRRYRHRHRRHLHQPLRPALVKNPTFLHQVLTSLLSIIEIRNLTNLLGSVQKLWDGAWRAGWWRMDALSAAFYAPRKGWVAVTPENDVKISWSIYRRSIYRSWRIIGRRRSGKLLVRKNLKVRESDHCRVCWHWINFELHKNIESDFEIESIQLFLFALLIKKKFRVKLSLLSNHFAVNKLESVNQSINEISNAHWKMLILKWILIIVFMQVNLFALFFQWNIIQILCWVTESVSGCLGEKIFDFF